MRSPEHIKRQEEKEIDSVKIKLKSHLVIEYRPMWDIGDDFGTVATVV